MQLQNPKYGGTKKLVDGVFQLQITQ